MVAIIDYGVGNLFSLRSSFAAIGEKAVVTASFDLNDAAEAFLRDNEIEAEDELIVQRRISADGKSSCRVCGVPVSAVQLKERGAALVDIHGQNDGRQLTDERRHTRHTRVLA